MNAEAKRYEVLRVREAQSAAQEANKQNVQSAKQEKQSKRHPISGDNGEGVPPVPIPNTEVKLISVENTWLATAWEDRAMPVQ